MVMAPNFSEIRRIGLARIKKLKKKPAVAKIPIIKMAYPCSYTNPGKPINP
ncbi:hypothetical protein C8P63_11794 [Melghirimyces profundicolus]|uniref:Uncharacterized protein n=1 Tax=Melghirimyces profundicolus TaxID=1242148 RepID=A0A2T6BQM9_9BACL|nr:hypothetical protein C8P63_11794 [Melghirimyces profundicolus]